MVMTKFFSVSTPYMVSTHTHKSWTEVIVQWCYSVIMLTLLHRSLPTYSRHKCSSYLSCLTLLTGVLYTHPSDVWSAIMTHLVHAHVHTNIQTVALYIVTIIYTSNLLYYVQNYRIPFPDRQTNRHTDSIHFNHVFSLVSTVDIYVTSPQPPIWNNHFANGYWSVKDWYYSALNIIYK